ncbi:MAG: hypothetical protein P1V34_03385 [Alphaproteobacteria bacterium]|nr:hypothetical protein [Alphaproteobacteria bacterium]
MILRFETVSSTLWLVTSRRDLLSIEPDGDGWTERWTRLNRHRALTYLEGLQDRRETIRIVRDMLSRNGEPRLATLDDDTVLITAAEQFSFGWAVEIDRTPPSGGWQDPDPSPPPTALESVPPQENPTGVPTKKEKDHFIIVELVGENGEPIPNEFCRLTLPDGAVVERETNSQGKVEEYGILEGDCVIEFPNLDKDAWEAKQA